MQSQTKLSIIFLGFKSSHQAHDKQFHHLSKLLDHVFCGWIFILRWWTNNFFFWILFLKCLVFYKKTKEFFFKKKWSTLFDYLEKFVITLLLFGEKKLFTIFLNQSSINAKSRYVCLASIPTYFRKPKNKLF